MIIFLNQSVNHDETSTQARPSHPFLSSLHLPPACEYSEARLLPFFFDWGCFYLTAETLTHRCLIHMIGTSTSWEGRSGYWNSSSSQNPGSGALRSEQRARQKISARSLDFGPFGAWITLHRLYGPKYPTGVDLAMMWMVGWSLIISSEISISVPA